jgi:hypothetical protein
MSDPTAFGFGKFVPGFDFLKNLASSTNPSSSNGAAASGLSSWVAPTLSVEEIDKRIQELKAVQFWLEQNGTALKATIQALEVQKMTLTTLQGMNVNMAELAKAFTARPPETTPEAATKAAAPATHEAQSEPAGADAAQAEPHTPPPTTKKGGKTGPRGAASSQAAPAAAVDPVQWWGSLTQQFQNIAAAAMQDVAAQAVKAPTLAKAKGSAPAAPARRAAKRAAPVASAKAGKTTARPSAGAKKARPSRA